MYMYLIVFAVSRRRSILTDWSKKQPKFDLFRNFRKIDGKIPQYHVKNVQILAEFSAQKSTTVKLI